MAKGKNLNPADAYRKAQRKKELKKNKTERVKVRDFSLVKKDTRDLEDEIEKLEASAELSAADKSRFTNLKNELSRIMQKKEEYVQEHPEQRKLVYRPRKQERGEDQKEAPSVEQKRNLFNKHGLPRHPERSIYYDPVMNPYGVAPPGMPYIERPLTADEVDSGGDVGDSDEDIVMPDGPPPGTSQEDGSDDDIPMPEGPPPGSIPDVLPPLPHISMSTPSLILPPPPPPPPPGFDGGVFSSPQMPPPAFSPSDSICHSHRASRLLAGHPSLPPKPSSGTPGTILTSGVHSGAIISAEPELRDLKREATAFVPASLKRKKVSGLPGSSKVNAAPSVNVGMEATSPQARPDLVGVLKSQLGAFPASPPNSQVPDKGLKTPVVKERDDYQNFVDEMSDLLGP
ncbi:WW domain binding protein 11-domain-containing protein [Boletus reticuloceps]|uniref:WW domain binding protein 11-domain-containing protein n=1 Tax=Boletus reticuloceps TaxID=495285 RepID=A0A8I3AFX6_9AGAM|nr:WW domain binding protein 11-domain-containing protein [Boletus reticuloceps]